MQLRCLFEVVLGAQHTVTRHHLVRVEAVCMRVGCSCGVANDGQMQAKLSDDSEVPRHM